MSFVLLALFFAIAGLALAVISRRGFESSLWPVCFVVIVILYASARLGGLSWGVLVVLALAVPSVAILVNALRVDRAALRSLVSGPAFLGYLAFVVFIYVWNVDRLFSHWDEFTHWGLVVKNMAIHDDFGNLPEATTFFRSYPPAASLFVYFFAKAGGGFDESLAYMAFGLLLFSILLGVFSGGFKHGVRDAVPVLLVALFVPVIFYGAEFYSKLYVDALLGLLFALILVEYYAKDRLDGVLAIRIGMIAAILALVKDSGLSLGIIAWLIIAVDFFRFGFRENRPGLLWLLVPVAACCIARYSWLSYLRSGAMEIAWDTSTISLAAIRNLAVDLPVHVKPTIVNFISSFYEQFAVPVLVIFGLLFGLGRLTSHGGFAKRVPTLSLGLGAGLGIYALSLLLLYVFTFKPEEAVIIASFHRYLSTFVLGALLVVLGAYAARVDTGIPAVRRFTRAGVIVLALLYLPLFVWRFADKKFDARVRNEYDHFISLSGVLDPAVDKVYYASGHHLFSSPDFFMSHYLATPLKVEGDSYLAMSGEGEEQGLIGPRSRREWEDRLRKNYSYFYLHSYPENFPVEFGDLFPDSREIGPRTLYRIDGSADRLSLVKHSSY